MICFLYFFIDIHVSNFVNKLYFSIMSSGLSEFSKWHKLLLLLILLIMKDIFVSENSSICFEILYSREVIKINVDILYLLVRT